MKKKLSYIIFLIISGFFLIGLFFSNQIFSKKIDFKSSAWELNDTLNFKFNSKSELNNNVVLFGKINQDYSFANIYLFIEFFVDDVKIKTDTLNCILYDSYGNPRHKNIGNIQLFKKNYFVFCIKIGLILSCSLIIYMPFFSEMFLIVVSNLCFF